MVWKTPRVLYLFIFFWSASELFAGIKAPQGLKGLVVFGDSLSDTGNACPQEGKQSNAFCSIYPTERFSDGHLWIEHLARHFGWSLKASALGGNNYAFGGATSGNGTLEVPGLGKQVRSYLRSVSGKARADHLYVTWIGGNDLKDKFLSLSFISNPSDVLLEDVLTNLEKNIRLLTEKGARTFLVPNLPPLHHTPVVGGMLTGVAGVFSGLSWLMQSEPETKSEAVAGDSGLRNFLSTGCDVLIASYNWRLATRLRELEQDLKIKIIYADVFHMFNNVIENHQKYGAEDSADLFYDFFHPSALAHRILASKIADLLTESDRLQES